MIRITTMILLCLFSLIAHANSWQVYTSPTGRFQINLPAQPERHKMTRADHVSYSITAQDDAYAVKIVFTDQDQILDDQMQNRLILQTLEVSQSTYGLPPVAAKKFSAADHRGWQVHFTDAQGHDTIIRGFFGPPNVMYTVMLSAKQAKLDKATIQTFFDSFAFTDIVTTDESSQNQPK